MSNEEKTVIQEHKVAKGHRFVMKDRALLIEVSPQNFGRIYKLDQPVTIIGRDKSCHIQLDDEECSKEHCSIRVDEEGFLTIEDEGSTNGTLVNGKKLKKPRLLNFVDRIVVGQTIFRFLREESL